MNDLKSVGIIAISPSSLSLAQKIQAGVPDSQIYCKKEEEGAMKITELDPLVELLFAEIDTIIFIGAMGICIRTIAPFIEDKYIDPAVICVDSTGKFIIPVLSGHIGGANQLSKEIALLLGAQPVITTRSDNTGLWALDMLASKFNWSYSIDYRDSFKDQGIAPHCQRGGLSDMLDTILTGEAPKDAQQKAHKAMNACVTAFVNKEPFALLIEADDEGTQYLRATCPSHVEIFHHTDDINIHVYKWLITVGPFFLSRDINTLAFYPRVLHLGVGCKKNLQGSFDKLYGEIVKVCFKNKINPLSIASISSIDLKKDEPMFHQLAEKCGCAFQTYSAEILSEVEVPTPSEKVESVTGSPSVSEAAACQRAGSNRLLIRKTKGQLGDTCDFTFAVALDQSAFKTGHIEIVGAGPGDPELISIRGRRMLEQADLILYAGSLVPKELTMCAKEGATVCSSADMNLEEQLRMMEDFYFKNKLVVRLHTGDPCIYGAIQEQMAFFDENEMNYHITPGISSFQAAAAALRSQFTIPEKVQTIILTRGEGRTSMPEKEQLHKLAESQSTMCIFLSAGIADDVQSQLLQHYAPTTPVAACYRLTWKDERIYRGELKDLARIVKENNLTLTTLLVVGDAIDNRQGLSRLYADEFKHLFRP